MTTGKTPSQANLPKPARMTTIRWQPGPGSMATIAANQRTQTTGRVLIVERTLVIIKPDGVQRGLIGPIISRFEPVSYTHLRAHETVLDLVCRLLLEKKKQPIHTDQDNTIYNNR